jgi:hypothetical protein
MLNPWIAVTLYDKSDSYLQDHQMGLGAGWTLHRIFDCKQNDLVRLYILFI